MAKRGRKPKQKVKSYKDYLKEAGYRYDVRRGMYIYVNGSRKVPISDEYEESYELDSLYDFIIDEQYDE